MTAWKKYNGIVNCVDTNGALKIFVLLETNHNLASESFRIGNKVQLVSSSIDLDTKISHQVWVAASLTKPKKQNEDVGVVSSNGVSPKILVELNLSFALKRIVDGLFILAEYSMHLL
jgi:hypothetical protein